jgi:hypothetical protein
MQYFQIAVLLFLMLFPNGCAGTVSHSKGKTTLQVRLLWQGSQCVANRLAPHATWIEDSDLFKKTFAGLTQTYTDAQQDLLSRVDFSREGLLMVAMGQKPTGGYGLELNRKVAVVSDNAAVVSLSWIEPQKGAIVPQLITNPCLVIVLPKGSYSQIRLLDQNAHLRLQVYIE